MARSKDLEYAWIAENLSKLKVTQADGSIGFIAYHSRANYDDLLTLLETHYIFDSAIPDVERRRIITKAVRESARMGRSPRNRSKVRF